MIGGILLDLISHKQGRTVWGCEDHWHPWLQWPWDGDPEVPERREQGKKCRIRTLYFRIVDLDLFFMVGLEEPYGVQPWGENESRRAVWVGFFFLFPPAPPPPLLPHPFHPSFPKDHFLQGLNCPSHSNEQKIHQMWQETWKELLIKFRYKKEACKRQKQRQISWKK